MFLPLIFTIIFSVKYLELKKNISKLDIMCRPFPDYNNKVLWQFLIKNIIS